MDTKVRARAALGTRARFLLPFRSDSSGLFDGDASAVIATLTTNSVIEMP